MDSLILITIILFLLSTIFALGNLYKYAEQKAIVKDHITEIVATTYTTNKKRIV